MNPVDVLRMRWIALCCVTLLVGCATHREITISARPQDALIAIDGADRGRGPITEKFTFHGDDDVHHVTATRLGYTPRTFDLTRSYDQPDLSITLQPRTKEISIHVSPVPAIVTVDGNPVGEGPIRDITLTLPFTVDDKNQWTEHEIKATRTGYQPAEQVVRWDDAAGQYTLALDAMRKDLAITTEPPGAEVSLNGHVLGRSPLTARNVAFPVDARTGKYLPQKLTVSKPGYDPVESSINWDNGRKTYDVSLVPKTKAVRVVTDPPGAVVKIDGRELEHDSSGASVGTLTFPPTDEKGDLRTYNAVISKKTAETEWIPEELTIAWDDGKTDYSVNLAEVKTRPVDLLRPKAVRTDEGWQIVPETLDTLAMKDVTEGPTHQPPVRIVEAPRGSVIDSLAVSPDGQWLLYTVLSGKTKADFRSQIQMVHSDGSGGPNMFGDARTLDLDPSFTPDGGQIVFASNRGGRHLSIWQMAASGEGGVTQLTGGDTCDLWPSIDSDPKPRLFYEALVDSRPDPRVYMTQLGTTLRTDLTQSGGAQPHVSPKADSVIFTIVNEKTGKRDIYKMSDRGGGAANLTNTPEFDNFDPAWSKDGNKIAFASDRGTDADGRHNFDIWVLDLLHPDKASRVTTNGSWDDCPAWDSSGKYIYFRSNRGGSWGIWRVSVK